MHLPNNVVRIAMEGDHMLSPHTINFPDDPDPLAKYRRECEQQEAEFARQRAHEERERQRAQAQQAVATNDYWAEVDRRIEEKFNVILEACGEGDRQIARSATWTHSRGTRPA
jgi:hypothetical protein